MAAAVGDSRAKDLVFSGRFAGAEEAVSLGLIDQLVAPDHVYDEAQKWARGFLDSSPEALATAKAAFAVR
ncbi:enoyl-CoA hydratase/carnithine racemase [Mycobacteroides abscessus subsp. abscessus]|nr:enoyl-CoA hydratase/carnithine racemase [Mycobacteroides abscessus subsp. abscessus]